MTDEPYSDRIPTRALIDDLLGRDRLQEDLTRAETERDDARRRIRVVTSAAESLDQMSLAAQRRLRTEEDPRYAAGYEKGMLDAREHVLGALRRSARPEVLAQVRELLASAELTDL